MTPPVGFLIPPNVDAKRDAVHVAILRVVSGESYLCAGQRIAIIPDTNPPKVKSNPRGIGVVDPFLVDSFIEEGASFWMFVDPSTVVGLRHEWYHPVIDRPPSTTESEKWLRAFASRWNFDYDELIENAAADSIEPHGRYVVAQGIDLHSAKELGEEDHRLFWQHLSSLTGKQFNKAQIESFSWGCSC